MSVSSPSSAAWAAACTAGPPALMIWLTRIRSSVVRAAGNLTNMKDLMSSSVPSSAFCASALTTGPPTAMSWFTLIRRSVASGWR